MLIAACGLGATAQKRVLNVYRNGQVIYSIPMSNVSKITVEDSDDYPYLKELCGVWTLGSIGQNDQNDPLATMDVSSFRLTLNADHTYTVDNSLPFIVEENGTWEVDNRLLPTKIIFRETGSHESAAVEIPYPYSVQDGQPRVTIAVSEGCELNRLSYVFTHNAD